MKEKTINTKYIVLFLNMFLLFMPTYITYKYSFVQNVTELYCIIILLTYAAKTIKEKRINKIILSIFMLCFIQLLSSIFNNNGINNSIMDLIKILGTCLFINYEIKKDSKKIIKTAEVYFLLVTIINIITIVLYPNGLYLSKISRLNQNWFLGYKNSHILFILPMYIFSFIDATLYNNKSTRKNFFVVIIGLINIVLIKSSTSLIVAALILIYITPIKKISNKIPSFKILIIYLISNYMIIFSKIDKVLGWLVNGILKKDLTFTGRTFIWDMTLSEIKLKPFLGHGDISMKFKSYTTIFSSSHNIILENLYKIGYIGIIAFLLILVLTAINLDKNKKCKLYPLFYLSFTAILVATISESYVLNMIMYLFVIFYNIDDFIKSRGEKDEKNI